MANNKRLINIFNMLISIILIEFMIIICLLNQEPKVIIEEKEVPTSYKTIE